VDTEELKQYLENHPDEDAYDLLINADPKFEGRFKRVCRSLEKLMGDITEHFPDATYYTASGGLHVILGHTHSGHSCAPNRELAALSAGGGLSIGDGDW
jgi:hypothetical protein